MRVVAVAVIAWVAGVLCALAYVSLNGYEYAHAGEFPPEQGRWEAIRSGGWEPIAVGDNLFLRRPRVRLGR